MPLISDITGVIFGSSNIQVIGLENVDLWYSENHSISVKVSSYPVEDGSTISDNAYREPYKIKLSGFITNIQQLTPDIPFLFGSTGYVTTQKAKTGWALLTEYANAREPFTVITTVKTYENMIITDVSTRIDEKTGTNLIFDLSFTEIKIVSTTETELQPINVQGDNNQARNSTDISNNGNKNAKTVNYSSFADVLLSSSIGI